MTFEPLLIVGLIVIGYLAGRTEALRYRTAHENGVRLWVEYLAYGFICFAGISVVAYAIHVTFGLWGDPCMMQESTATCSARLLEYLAAYLDGAFIKTNLLLLFGLSTLTAWGLPWLLNATYYKKSSVKLELIRKQLINGGNQMEMMLFNAIDQGVPVLFVLDNNAVCLGLPRVIPDPIYDNTQINILTVRNGYLDDGHNIVFTDDYRSYLFGSENDIEKVDVDKLQKILPRSKIVSADIFDLELYGRCARQPSKDNTSEADTVNNGPR